MVSNHYLSRVNDTLCMLHRFKKQSAKTSRNDIKDRRVAAQGSPGYYSEGEEKWLKQ